MDILLYNFINLKYGDIKLPQANWGSKHICQECEAKYYDMGRSPIICPSCGVELVEKPILSKSSSTRDKNPQKPEGTVKEAEEILADSVLDNDDDDDDLPDDDVLPDLGEDDDADDDASSVVDVNPEK